MSINFLTRGAEIMTGFDELTPYSYMPDTLPDGVTALNVGWLEGTNEFRRGDTPDGFLGALLALIREHPAAKTRGWHACSLPHPEGRLPYPHTVEGDEGAIRLGAAEVRVVSETGDVLAAPDLVYHYVNDHGYLPPDAFVEAVMARRWFDAP
jgi:hypothetical protein